MCGLVLGFFHQGDKDLVTMIVSNVLAISCVNYVGQKLKIFFERNGSDLAYNLVEENLLHKPLNTANILLTVNIVSG